MTSRGDLYVSGLNTGKRLSFSTTITKNNQEIFREFTKVSENIIDIKIGPSHSVIWLSNGTILNVDNGKITQVKIPNSSSVELNLIRTTKNKDTKAQCSKIRKKVQFQKFKKALFAFSKMAQNQFLQKKKV